MTFLKKNSSDLLISLVLMVCTLFYAARFVDFSIPPFEDAAMLMRYAQHLAGGHGIVWNISEHPVDGATDFLFMVVSALAPPSRMLLPVLPVMVFGPVLPVPLMSAVPVRVRFSRYWS